VIKMAIMKIYRIWQEVNNTYDTYDSVIVCAENEEEAKRISPSEFREWNNKDQWVYNYGDKKPTRNGTWCELEYIQVELIGNAKKGTKKGVILASFNAG